MSATKQEKIVEILIDFRIQQYTVIEGDHHIWRSTLRAGSDLPVLTIPYTNPCRQLQVRRHIFEKHVRPLVGKEHVTDTCGNKRCINPAHLIILDRTKAWKR